MKLNNSTLTVTKHCTTEIPAFRSELRSLVVGNATLKTSDLTGLDPDGAKVSEHKLEQYLNGCSPTCHG